MTNFIRRFLNCFDTSPQFGPGTKPNIWDVSARNMAAACPAAPRVPATLEQFASRFSAPNGEGVIDPAANRNALLEVAPYAVWKQIERDAHE